MRIQRNSDPVQKANEAVQKANAAVSKANAAVNEANAAVQLANGPAQEGNEEFGKWWTLIAACAGVFIILLDVTIVNVALPSIGSSLNASFDDLQWVVDAYALSLGALVLLAGSLGDVHGRRNLFMVGLSIFTLSSVVAGASSSILMLEIARGVQGIGGAMIFANTPAMLAQTYEGKDLGLAFGVWGGTTGAAVALGPLVGGLLTTDLSWRWIFYVNVPVALGAMALCRARVRGLDYRGTSRIDWAGALTFFSGLFLLLLGLIRSNQDGWGSPLVVGSLIGAAGLLVVFVLLSVYRDDPILDLGLLRKRRFTGTLLAAFALGGSILGLFLYITLFLQNILGFSALEAGVRLLAITLPVLIFAPLSGRLSTRIPYNLLLGTGLLLTGIGIFLMSGVSADSDWTVLLPGFILSGAGLGITGPILGRAVIDTVPLDRAASASGAIVTGRQVGLAVSVAALGTVFHSAVTSKVETALAKVHAPTAPAGDIAQSLAAGGSPRDAARGLPHAAQAVVVDGARAAFTHGLHEIMLIGGVVALIGSALAFVLVREARVQTVVAPSPEEVAVQPEG